MNKILKRTLVIISVIIGIYACAFNGSSTHDDNNSKENTEGVNQLSKIDMKSMKTLKA